MTCTTTRATGTPLRVCNGSLAIPVGHDSTGAGTVQNGAMQLTHFGHSCLLASFADGKGGDTSVLFDPGNFSHGFEGITGLSAILITHQHPDHADTERLPALVDANPKAALYAAPQT